MSNGIFLLLGTNLGSRLKNLNAAIQQINFHIGKVVCKSSVYETAPWGVTNQPLYLNQAVQIETSLDAEQLLIKLLEIEKIVGRVRDTKWAARVMDIDILFFNDEVILSKALQIPHPRLHLRNFALVPMAEIASGFIHPIIKKSITALLKESEDTLHVTPYMKQD